MPADQQIAVFLRDKVLAQAMTSDCEYVEGNWYFPDQALGEASYYNYQSDEGLIKDIAWYYPRPKNGAEKVEGRVAFYVGKVDGLKLGEPSI
ncbi:hypothetical protein I312_101005 [Cryptococcus bacillisporus CA1280]|uniref:uncharacterized protein n=1 Tax=Cryptococcus bacillisporus CA1280 TaxID=1296109 RepID=UPI003368C946